MVCFEGELLDLLLIGKSVFKPPINSQYLLQYLLSFDLAAHPQSSVGDTPLSERSPDYTLLQLTTSIFSIPPGSYKPK